MISNEKRIVSLTKQLSTNDWFDSIQMDEFGKMVVFVRYATKDVMDCIPDKFEDKRVVWQYANSKPELVKAKYNSITTPAYNYTPSFTQIVDNFKYVDINVLAVSEADDVDIKFLISELDRLEKICGSSTLQSIFYEVHDQKNAVTKFQENFPEIYDDMLDLYEEFGFDLIYDELDG